VSQTFLDFLFIVKSIDNFYFFRVGVVQWNNDAYEQVLFERTKDACRGLVDLAISFDLTMRSLLRAINCLKEAGYFTFR